MYEIKYRGESELRNSGVEWLKEVPINWNHKKIKYTTDRVKNGIWGDDEKENANDIPCVRITNFDRGNNKIDINNLTVRNLNILKQKEYLLKKNDLLIEKSGGGEKQPVGFVCIYQFNKPMIYANFMAKIIINKEYSSEFMLYCFRDLYNKRVNMKHVNQTTGIQNINTTSYFNEKVFLPYKAEQLKIANFLDIKIAQFDQIISKKEQLIEKLEEAKKSLISEVVTGKVKIVDGQLVERDASEMKDSGVEWIGKIPVYWNVLPMKRRFRIKKKPIYRDDNVVLSLTQRGLKLKDLGNNQGQHAATYSGYQEVLPYDFVMNHMDLLTGFVDCSTFTGVTSPDYRVFQLIEETSKSYSYYLRYFQMCYWNRIFYSYGQGVSNYGRWRLQTESFKYFPILTSDENEQLELTEVMDEKVRQIEIVVEKVVREIKRLKQAKQSLISEAVTGKIDLRDWEIIEEGEMQ